MKAGEPRKYRFICILEHPVSSLHIHILDNFYLKPLEKFSATISPKIKNNFLFQWGSPVDLKNKIRREKVSAKEIKKFGEIGIGSAFRGEEKKGGIGGGEGFLFNDENFRIIKGNEVLKASDDEKYWTFQIADFSGAKKVSGIKKISGRKNLKKILLEKANGKGFVATFDAEFIGEFFARSNGIFPEDKVKNREESLFEKKIKGGHLVGGDAASGNIKSLKNKFSEERAKQIDFAFKIAGPVLLKSHNSLVLLS
jgi:hypothetical protein